MDDEPSGALVVDASAIVDLLLDAGATESMRRRIRGNELHAPAHFDAEVLSALGRLHRAGHLTPTDVSARLELLQRLPIYRHQLPLLLTGTWNRRGNLRLVDAFYVELAEQLDAPIITTDKRLAAAVPQAELPP
ncbi:MAG: type II toxin-antitoxin system VapC family toxin [Acidimicrobiaceae bacterium]|nr:type II toxin-antitoxin system VapC family toxin [Acidimicrobiaceae bacterium]